MTLRCVGGPYDGKVPLGAWAIERSRARGAEVHHICMRPGESPDWVHYLRRDDDHDVYEYAGPCWAQANHE